MCQQHTTATGQENTFLSTFFLALSLLLAHPSVTACLICLAETSVHAKEALNQHSATNNSQASGDDNAAQAVTALAKGRNEIVRSIHHRCQILDRLWG